MSRTTKIQLRRLVVILTIIIITFSSFYWMSLYDRNEKVSEDVTVNITETAVKTVTKTIQTDHVPIGTYHTAVNYDQGEFEMFCRVAYAEAGIDGKDGVKAVMCSIRNATLKFRVGDISSELLHENGYETVITDEEGNFIEVRVPSQEINFEDVPSEYIELAQKVLLGQVPDSTKGAVGFIPLEATTTPNVEDFARKYNLPEGSYIQIGSQIFYKEWTPEMNNISWNTSW